MFLLCVVVVVVVVVVFKPGAVNEVLVKPECVELAEECGEESGLSEEALSAAVPLEQALNQVRNKKPPPSYKRNDFQPKRAHWI